MEALEGYTPSPNSWVDGNSLAGSLEPELRWLAETRRARVMEDGGEAQSSADSLPCPPPPPPNTQTVLPWVMTTCSF